MGQILEIPKLPGRPVDGHKGTFGKVLIVGGSAGMSGAPALSGRAAIRSGAGLVRVAVPASIQLTVAAIEPCYTTVALAEDCNGSICVNAVSQLLDLAEQNDIVAFGPGVSTSKGVSDCLDVLLAQPGLRIVIDADGLNCLAKTRKWVEYKKASLILTPHPGEMRRLWKNSFRESMPADRVEQAVEFAKHADCTVVLKGAGTVVADSEQYYVNTTGNCGMATAGSGDVLTGVITSLGGQGLDDFNSAVLGVFVHGLAGDMAARKTGKISLIATDVIDSLGEAFIHTEELETKKSSS